MVTGHWGWLVGGDGEGGVVVAAPVNAINVSSE